jgi:hypothetical protein
MHLQGKKKWCQPGRLHYFNLSTMLLFPITLRHLKNSLTVEEKLVENIVCSLTGLYSCWRFHDGGAAPVHPERNNP